MNTTKTARTSATRYELRALGLNPIVEGADGHVINWLAERIEGGQRVCTTVGNVRGTFRGINDASGTVAVTWDR